MSLSSRRNQLPSVYKFAKERNFIKKSGQSTEYTHTVLDGSFVCFGPIEIPDDSDNLWLRLFYAEYANSWERNDRLYMVEWPRPGQPHRLYFDFDMYFAASTPHCEPSAMRAMFANMQQCLQRDVFPSLRSNQFTLLVGSGGWSTTHKRLGKDQQEREYVKLGLHLIWRDIFIDTKWLPAIRHAVLRSLQSRFPNGTIANAVQLQNSWDTVVDEHIAKRASSRMFGSAKLDYCHCRKEKKECTHEKDRSGKGKGRVDVGRVYNLAAVVDNNGDMLDDLLEQLNNHKFQLLWAASLCIRPPPNAVPDQIAVDTAAQQQQQPKKARVGAGTDMPDDDKNIMLIRHYLLNCYGAELAGIRYNKRHKTYTCQTTSRRCFNNFDEEHNSACGYFLVSVYLLERVERLFTRLVVLVVFGLFFPLRPFLPLCFAPMTAA